MQVADFPVVMEELVLKAVFPGQGKTASGGPDDGSAKDFGQRRNPAEHWGAVGAFQHEVSVDQDLSVIVAETINDDDVKQRLVPIVFTRG